MKNILVVGSMNMDLVIDTDEIPSIGETVLGNSLSEIAGGKGANQAVAMAKLGKNVSFLGKIGNDLFGDDLIKSMKKSGVNTSHIERVDTPTGIAVINVDIDGNNNIVVIPGANFKVDKDYLHRHIDAFKAAYIIVFQLEIPKEAVKEGLKIAKNLNKATILNPAPAMDLDDEILKNTDILIPNEHELRRITGVNINDNISLLKASNILIQIGIENIIVTLGEKGALFIDKHSHKFFESFEVEAIDTTAAGDSFIGGFTSAYIEDGDIERAIEMGQISAALAIQKRGAQSSLPTIDEVNNFSLDL